MTIGENIRKLRTEYKLTQKELGELIGTSQQMIAQYETGKRNPKIETLNKIAQVLNTTSCKLSYTLGAWTSITEHFLKVVSDSLDVEEVKIYEKLLISYNSLNQDGKKEAIKRVEELTRLEEYTKPDTPGSPSDSDTSARMSDQVAADEPEPGSRKE